MYVCEELLCFFLCSVSFLFLSLCSVMHYAHDCSFICTYMYMVHVVHMINIPKAVGDFRF